MILSELSIFDYVLITVFVTGIFPAACIFTCNVILKKNIEFPPFITKTVRGIFRLSVVFFILSLFIATALLVLKFTDIITYIFETKNTKETILGFIKILLYLGLSSVYLVILGTGLKSLQYFTEDYETEKITKKIVNSFAPFSSGIRSILRFPKKIVSYITTLIFHPTAYLLVGSFLFIKFNKALKIESDKISQDLSYPFFGINGDLFLKEFGIFLIIAGLASFVLESKGFVKKASDLIFLHSDYLKNMSEEKKKEFFAEILRNTYKFSDYGVESEFSEMAVETFLPVFENSYTKNYIINRKFNYIVFPKKSKEVSKIQKILTEYGYSNANQVLQNLKSPWRGTNEEDFFVDEEKTWSTHFSKTAKKIEEKTKQRSILYLNYEHLLQRLLTFQHQSQLLGFNS